MATPSCHTGPGALFGAVLKLGKKAGKRTGTECFFVLCKRHRFLDLRRVCEAPFLERPGRLPLGQGATRARRTVGCCFVLLVPTPEEYRVPRVNPGVTASKLFPPLLPSLATPGRPLPCRPLQKTRVCCFVLLVRPPEEYRVPRAAPGVTASKLFPLLLPSLLPCRALQNVRYYYPRFRVGSSICLASSVGCAEGAGGSPCRPWWLRWISSGIGVSLPQELSTAGLVSYTWVARSRSGSSSFTALALNKPSSSSSSSSSSSCPRGAKIVQ